MMALAPPLPPATPAAPIDLVWDMETGDPDDFLTLLLLLGHPAVRLRAVTVTPGTPDQIGVVRAALSWFGREGDVPVGAFDLAHRTASAGTSGRHGRRGQCVSSWHYAAYGELPPSSDAVPGPELLRDVCDERTTLVTGGPLRNLGRALQLPGFRLGRLVAQGGFAGEGVVPPERELPKFRGRRTVATYNFNGDRPAARAVLATDLIGARRFVSKNVCHGVVYDRALHARVGAVHTNSPSLQRIWHGMEAYLGPERGPLPRNGAIVADPVRLVNGDPATRPRPVEMPLADALVRARDAGLDLVAVSRDPVPVCRLLPAEPEAEPSSAKALHDPLAACCAIDEGIGTWAEVELYREGGEWGSRLSPGSGVFIIVGYDHERFVRTLLASADR